MTEEDPTPATHAAVADLVTAVGRQLPTTVDVDSWTPTVQGAVGHVVGLRGAEGSSYVLKVYEPGEGRRAAREVSALRLFGGVPQVPVPDVLLHGELSGGEQPPYVLMTRLPGVRWADRRAALDSQQSLALHRRVGQLLHRMHVLSRDRFGDLLADGPRWPTAWASVEARCDRLVGEHVQAGGPAEVGRRVRRLVGEHRGAVDSCAQPVLCHNDLIDSNLLVTPSGEPELCGVVDLERASWDDPLLDLARTKLHTTYHDPAASKVLVEAYGVRSGDERVRLRVHEVLHALEERIWISSDRPAGWKRSIKNLDAFLMDRT